MRIESIRQTRSPSGKQRLQLDNGKSLLLLPAVIAQYGLYAGMELEEETYLKLCTDGAKASCKDRALRIISQSTVSKRDLEQRLVQKGETPEHAAEAVQWLQELRLLDDRQAAQQIVRSGLAKGYGEARIRQMLYEKRIPKSLWDEVLEDLPGQEDAIDAFLQKRFRGAAPDRAACKRACDALLRRGHKWSEIRRAMERYVPDEVLPEE
ncbi:MAG: regulatory protein RecX [Oscillospiraceae bacterium]|nr:regulatory protein RecX [Oscillospiraceae bacterium]